MSKTSDEGNTRWDQIMGNFDLLFAQINDLGLSQQELKTQVTAAQEEQKKIAKQVQANGQAVASLTIRHMEKEKLDDSSDNASVVSADETVFDNVFAAMTHDHKPSTSKRTHGHFNKDQLPHHSIPKMQFPMFDGTSPKIWIDNCCNYFTIYNIIESLKVTAAVMHLEGNAAKWWQAYKQNHSVPTW